MTNRKCRARVGNVDDVSTGGVDGGARFGVRRTPRWLREVGLVALIYLAYEASRGLQSGHLTTAMSNGWHILRWEQDWDLAPEHLLTQALTHLTPLAVGAAYFYSTMHYLVTPVVLIWLYRRHADNYAFARTALAISTVIGLFGFYAFPTAPPRLLRGAGVPDTLFDVRNWGWWGGEGSVPRGLGSLTNQFAAMPSMHVGWALWCGVLIARHASRRWVRWVGIAYPIVTTLVVLSTGNHYLLDAVVGAMVMGLGAAGAWLLQRALHGAPLRAVTERLRPVGPITARPASWPLLIPFFGAFSPSAYTLYRERGSPESALSTLGDQTCAVGAGD
jgi:hypothetical protein